MNDWLLRCAFAFVSFLYVMDLAAEERPLLGVLYPRISPEGESIAFAWQGAIWRIPSGGGEMKRLSREQGYDSWPSWSPDGQQIAFINGRGSNVGPIQLISADDGEVIPLRQRAIAKDKLEFSPDGSRILAMFARERGRFALSWLELSSGELGAELVEDVWGTRYALSPDGESIALVKTRDVRGEQGGNNGPQCDIAIVSADGGKPIPLTSFPARVYDLTWTSDGKSLILVSNLAGVHNDLWRIDLSDPIRSLTKLTFGRADEDMPSMDRAGRLVFTNNSRGLTALAVREDPLSLNKYVTQSHRDYGSEVGELKVDLRDHHDGQSVTARVSVRDSSGKYHGPPDKLYRMLGNDLHFYADGEFSLQIPVGSYEIKVARGPEYRVARHPVVIGKNGETELHVSLERWTNQREDGWYSGESHIHANYGYGQWYNTPRTMFAQSSGEDLVVSNFMVANSEADGVFDREFFRGGPDPLSSNETILYWNEEFRSTIYGHLTLLNLKRLVEPIFTGFAHTTHPHDHPTNADIADHVHDQNGHVNYTHPAHNVKDPYLSAYSAKALPMDVALGKVDSIDVMGANHEANMGIWYRLLNCGFRIPASAGTDCFLNRVRSRLPGQVRVYVQVHGEFSYQGWINGLKGGQTFVTNGPMVRFSVGEHRAGGVVALDGPGSTDVVADIKSQFPLDRVEIVRNGKVVYVERLKPETLAVTVERTIEVPTSGWIAVRVSGPNHVDLPTGNLFAHSSPIYLEVEGTSIDSREDARYFVQWIDRLRSDIRLRNRVPGRHQVSVESQLAEAVRVFQTLSK